MSSALIGLVFLDSVHCLGTELDFTFKSGACCALVLFPGPEVSCHHPP